MDAEIVASEGAGVENSKSCAIRSVSMDEELALIRSTPILGAGKPVYHMMSAESGTEGGAVQDECTQLSNSSWRAYSVLLPLLVAGSGLHFVMW